MATPPSELRPGDAAGPLRVLLVDDSEDDYVLTRDLLAEIPDGRYHLDWCSDDREALDAICRGEHNIYLIDYRLGALSGIELIRQARDRGCPAPMILLTGLGQREVDFEAMSAGAADYLEKDRLDATTLERTIRYSLQQKRHEEQLERKVQERTAELAHANAALQAEIAERVRAEAALREEDRRTDLFLATLGHELRNPLVPIRNALEIMRMAADRPQVVERSRAMIERQITQMVSLVNGLVDLSRIKSGTIQLRRDRLTLTEAVEAALESSRPFIQSSGQTLSVELPDEPLIVHVDPTRFAQVLVNLLNNAAKYGRPDGRVRLIITRDADDPSGHSLLSRVLDDGQGIPAEMLGRIFDVFTQLSRTDGQAREGLGIGLSLVKTLVELHGGTIEARSDGLDLGSEFLVRMPVIVPAA